MELSRMKQLAGINESDEMVNEIVDMASLTDLEDVQNKLGHCKKALAMANKLPDPADRKKWKGAALANLNRVRAALKRITDQIERDIHAP